MVGLAADRNKTLHMVSYTLGDAKVKVIRKIGP